MSSKKTKTSVKDLKIKKNPKGGATLKEAKIGPTIMKIDS